MRCLLPKAVDELVLDFRFKPRRWYCLTALPLHQDAVDAVFQQQRSSYGVHGL